MMIKTKYNAVLKLKTIEILEGHLKKNGLNVNGNLNLSVTKKIEQSNDDYNVFLDVKLSSDDDSLQVYVKSKAVFSTNIDNKELIERNGIAIMFPYVRSYVSLLTTQPGMAPIVMPAINIVELLKDQQNQ